MKKEEFDKINELENKHWWYVGMRKIWERMLRKFGQRPNFRNILDLGCGTGGNLSYLKNFGHAKGMEFDKYALEICKNNGYDCFHGSVLDIPKNEKFDLITSFDVLYQFSRKDVFQILKSADDILEKGGLFLIREPAFELLKGGHDEFVGTKSRFTQQDFLSIFSNLGYEIVFLSYLNFLLFIPILFKRKLDLILNKYPTSDVKLPKKYLNSILEWVLSLEVFLLDFLTNYQPFFKKSFFPFGVSILIIARKT